MRQWHHPGRARSLARSATLVLTGGAAVAATVTPVHAQPATPVASTPAAAVTPASVPAGSGPITPVVEGVKVPAANATQAGTSLATGDPVAAELTPTRTRDFGMVGITWNSGFPSDGVVAQIRTRVDGRWTAWQDLEVEEPAAETGPGIRSGTAPLWIGEADGVAARVSSPTGEKPTGLRVATIDPGTGPAVTASEPSGSTLDSTADSTAGSTVVPAVYDPTTIPDEATAVSSSRPAFTPRPRIVSRKRWGADPRLAGPCDTPHAAPSMRGVVIHHTAGANDYSRRDAAAQVRGAYAYHTRAQGWCDIGYNFLVDRFGTIYKGRRGSSYLAIRGAHAGNWDVNTYATGISMIGNYHTRAPSAALQKSMVKLVGWKLATNYLPARGRYGVAGRTLPMISGHRDVYNRGIRPGTSTACPGRYGYRWLNERHGLRARVASYISNYDTAIKQRRARLGSRAIGRVHAGERSTHGGRKTVFTRSTGYYKQGYGTSFLSGPILSRYRSLHQERGVLGFVRTNIHEFKQIRGLTRATFEHGRIYARRGTASAVYGDIWLRYRQLGKESGRLGYPTTSVYRVKRGLEARFRGGHIIWYRASDRARVFYR